MVGAGGRNCRAEESLWSEACCLQPLQQLQGIPYKIAQKVDAEQVVQVHAHARAIDCAYESEGGDRWEVGVWLFLEEGAGF